MRLKLHAQINLPPLGLQPSSHLEATDQPWIKTNFETKVLLRRDSPHISQLENQLPSATSTNFVQTTSLERTSQRGQHSVDHGSGHGILTCLRYRPAT